MINPAAIRATLYTTSGHYIHITLTDVILIHYTRWCELVDVCLATYTNESYFIEMKYGGEYDDFAHLVSQTVYIYTTESFANICSLVWASHRWEATRVLRPLIGLRIIYLSIFMHTCAPTAHQYTLYMFFATIYYGLINIINYQRYVIIINPNKRVFQCVFLYLSCLFIVHNLKINLSAHYIMWWIPYKPMDTMDN